MKISQLLLSVAFVLGTSPLCSTAEPTTMTVVVEGIPHGSPIPAQFAYCMPDGHGKTKTGPNLSPKVSWSGAPSKTKSFALVVVDRDVPTEFSSANQDGKSISASLARRNFYHWLLLNIPSDVTSIEAGKGKSTEIPGDLGVNDFAPFQPDKSAKTFFGYDGPCPPWNDEALHHYHFIVYALDTAHIELPPEYNGTQATSAIQGHILGQAEIIGTFTNNSRIR